MPNVLKHYKIEVGTKNREQFAVGCVKAKCSTSAIYKYLKGCKQKFEVEYVDCELL